MPTRSFGAAPEPRSGIGTPVPRTAGACSSSALAEAGSESAAATTATA